MLKKVKCLFFLKVLFSHLTEGQKLKMSKYNKTLQRTLDRRLIHYKSFSGRYVIYEPDGKAKEFDGFCDALIYEGEYKNGKRNGKGKEFDDFFQYLIFEGEYKNGKRNGKGKEYKYELNDIRYIFEGEYLNNKKISGVSYTQEGNKQYDRKEFKLKNGKIKEYNFNNKLIFEGEYINGERNGKGKEYYSIYHGIKFEGIYINGKKWEGKGYDSLNNLIYELKGGKGFIKEYDENEDLICECEYKNGLKNGKGKEYYYEDDEKIDLLYEGEYLNGLKNGKGKEFKYGKLLFEGEFYNGHRLKGKYYMNGKLEFEGEFLFDKKWDGKGYDDKRNIIYELHNGTGKVKEIKYDFDIIFEGEYLDGLNSGKGKEYNLEGILVFEGEYKNGKRNGNGKEYGNSPGIVLGPKCAKGNGWIRKIINKNDYGKLIFEGEYKDGKKNVRKTTKFIA